MNKDRTVPNSGTNLTQPRSGSDLAEPALHAVNFDIEAARTYFIAQRVIDGPSSALGHRWSNMVEQTWNYHFCENAVARENLKFSIFRSWLEVRALRRGESSHVLLSKPMLAITFAGDQPGASNV